MTVRFSAGSVTVLPKTAQINQTLDTDSARETLLEITRELVSGSGVKSGYLRLHLDKDSPTLSRGGGHVRSGYSAARSLVEQLVHTAYGENSPAAASLQTYLNGRTKIGTRSLVKLVAAMEGESAPDLARFRELKNTRLQAPVGGAKAAADALTEQALEKAQNDLERALAPLDMPRPYRGLGLIRDLPTDQLDEFKATMVKIDQARDAQQGRLDQYRQALAAGAQDPFAATGQSNADLIERFFNPDLDLRAEQRAQIAQGMASNLNPDQIAEQVKLDAGVVADAMVSIQLDEAWAQADQGAFVARLLKRADGDVAAPLYPQARQVQLLLTPDNLRWYGQLLSEGISRDAAEAITQPALKELALRYVDLDPLLSRDMPPDDKALKAQMKEELLQAQGQVIASKGRSPESTYGQALNEAGGLWRSQWRASSKIREFLDQWKDHRSVGATGASSVAERMIQGRIQEVEQIRQRSIATLLDSISMQWNARRIRRLDQLEVAPEALEAETLAFETALDVASAAMEHFDAANETAASHSQRLKNIEQFKSLSEKVRATLNEIPLTDVTGKLQTLAAKAERLNQRDLLNKQLETEDRKELVAELSEGARALQRELVSLQYRAGPLEGDNLKAFGALNRQVRLTQQALAARSGDLPLIEEAESELESEDDEARIPTPSAQPKQPWVASRGPSEGTQAQPPSALTSRLAELQRSNPARHAEYMSLTQKMDDARGLDQWLDVQSKNAAMNPAVLKRFKQGVAQKVDLYDRQMQALIDSETGRLDGRTRLSPEIRAQVLAEDSAKFLRGDQFKPFLNQFLKQDAGRDLLRGHRSVDDAIDALVQGQASVAEARALIDAIGLSFTQWEVDQADRSGAGKQAGKAINPGEQVLKRIGGKRIANAGDGHCLFLSFGHFQDPKAAAPGQAGKKPQQDLIRSERQGLLDQALRLTEAQYQLMGTDPRSQDLDKAESVERLLIGLNSGVGTDERGWGWVGHFPLKAMQAQRPVLLISEDGQTRAWGPNGQETKLSAKQISGRSPMGQGEMLLALAKDKTHNPKGAAPIVVFNRHNHFEAVQVP